MTDSAPKTFDNEPSLPRVPLPSLEQSCELFLEWCAPLLTSQQLAQTSRAVGDMLQPGSPAHTLHAALATDNHTAGVYSWLDSFWAARYLGRRDRIALNANFFFLFPDTGQTQIDRAADLIARASAYKLQIDQQTLPPVTLRGQPLSMEQHKFLFSTTRLPGTSQDTVHTPQDIPQPARHIVVFYHGTAFQLDVIGPDGMPYNAGQLQHALAAIVASGANTPDDRAIGHLTTKARADWAASRQSLLIDNAAALDTIETALFCLSLDRESPADARAACDQLLHGNSADRWFDKSVSLIVFANGQAGINVEHCKLDGTTILNFVDAIASPTPDQPVATGQPPAARPITFRLTSDQRADIQTASDEFRRYSAASASRLVAFDFGSDVIKQYGVSPDAFAQLAYQLAYYRAAGTLGATYEAIATRQYQHGRTEAMRVVTPQIVEFVTAMGDPAATRTTKQSAFQAAAGQHVARAKQCQAGHAPEQHLWQLQLLQQQRGHQLGAAEPMALYDSPGWRIMRDDYLSTSSAPSVNVDYFGFGSTSPHCIGIGYVLLPDHWNIYLGSPAAMTAKLDQFADNLQAAVQDLRQLLA